MKLHDIVTSITRWDEHVPEVQRYIRTLNERVHTTVCILPFNNLLHRLIVEMVYNPIFLLNRFHHLDGTHPKLSQCTIVTGSKIIFNKHFKLKISNYMQMHLQHNNSGLPRTSRAISLYPTRNAQCSY